MLLSKNRVPTTPVVLEHAVMDVGLALIALIWRASEMTEIIFNQGWVCSCKEQMLNIPVLK